MNRRADRQSDGLGDASLLLRRGLWGSRRAAPRTPTLVARAVCLTMKPVGEPDAGNPHVRFDERGWETERCRMAQATAPILDSTKAAVRCDAKNRRVLKVNRTAFRRLVPLPTSTPSRSRRLYREKVLDRRS